MVFRGLVWQSNAVGCRGLWLPLAWGTKMTSLSRLPPGCDKLPQEEAARGTNILHILREVHWAPSTRPNSFTGSNKVGPEER